MRCIPLGARQNVPEMEMDIITMVIYFIICRNCESKYLRFQDAYRTMHLSKRNSASPPKELQKVWEHIQADGRWGHWSPWTCDAVCGEGAYFRKRQCIPSEEFGIPVCDGNNIERSDKKCDVQCPAITSIRHRWIGPILSQTEKHLHYNILTSGHGAFIRKVGDLVLFECNYILTMHFLKNYSKSVLYWEKNGKKLRYDFTRMMFAENGNLGISELWTSDTGVYTCNVKFSKQQQLTILVFSLIVIGEQYDLHVTTNQEVPVTCNSDVIGKLFPGLHAQWIVVEVNTTQHVLKDYGVIPPENINVDTISEVKETDTGLWICVVRDLIFKRTWLTNAFIVQVNASTWDSGCEFVRRTLTSPYILGLIMGVGIIILILLVANRQWRRKRKQRLLKKLNLILEMSDKVGQQTSDAMKLDDEKHYDRPSEKQTEEFAQKLQSKAKKQKSSRIQSHIFKNVLHALNWAIINGQKDEFDQEPPVTQSVSKTDDHVLLNRLIYPIRLVHLLDESTSDLQKDLTKEQRVKRLLYKIRRLEIVDDHDDINMN